MLEKRNRTIDLLRFIFSILIIGVHTDLFKEFSTPLYYCFTRGIARIGVPFFFVASGYFLKAKLDSGKSPKQNILRNLCLWIIFILLDLLITGKYYYPMYPSLGAFLHRAFVTGLSHAYWYLPVLIVSQLIMVPVFRKGGIKAAMIIGLVLYLFSMTHDSYSFLFEGTWIYRLSELHLKIFIFPQGGLVESIFFLSLGGYICEKKDKLTDSLQNKGKGLLLLIIGLTAVLMAEAYFTQSSGAYEGNCYLTLIFLPAVIFLWALCCDPVKADTSRLGRMSLYIYLIHPLAASVTFMMGVNSILKMIIATVFSVAVSYAVTAIEDKKRNAAISGK